MQEASEALEYERAAGCATAARGRAPGRARASSPRSSERGRRPLRRPRRTATNAAVSSWSCAAARCSTGASSSGRGGAADRRARCSSELLPQVYDRTTLHPQGDPPAGDDRGGGGAARLAVGDARASGSTCGCRRAAPRPSGWRWPMQQRRVRVPPPLPRRRPQPRPRRERCAATSTCRSRRGASRASTSRTLQGGETVVASVVSGDEGRMRKGDYRSFNIRGLAGPGRLRARSTRRSSARYRRLLEEVGRDARPDPDRRRPRPAQRGARRARAARASRRCRSSAWPSARRSSTCRRVPSRCACRARRRRAPAPAAGPRRGAPLRALAPPAAARRSASLRSLLDELPGVGPVRRRALLRRFGTVESLRAATSEELREVVGPALAARLSTALAAAAPSTAAETGID